MSWKSSPCLLIVALVLTGCANSMPRLRPPTPPVPVNLAKSCPELERVTVDSWDAVARGYLHLAMQYGECGAIASMN